MDNSEKLINEIKERQLRPLPRWRFTLQNMAAWLVFGFAVIFGALAFSVILFAVQQVDFKLAGHLSHSWFEMLLVLMPFFWVIFLVIILVIAIIGIRNSKKGYKFTSLSLTGISAALSVLIGTLFFISGGGKWLDQTFEAHVDVYESVQDNKVKLWSMPEEGFLSGTVVTRAEDTIDLEDFMGKTWKIDISEIDIVPAVRLVPGEKIKMIGKMTSGDTFTAEKIRPWGGAERMRGYRQNK